MEMSSLWLYAFFVLLLPTEGFKILVYSPSISRSHLISNARLADVLAQDGHDVTLLQLNFGPDYKMEFVKNARLWTESFEWPARDVSFRPAAFAKKIFSEGSLLTDYWQMIGWQDRFMDACEHIIHSKDLVKKIKDEKFDVYIGEQLDLCGSGLSKALGIPIHIMMHSCPLMQHVASFVGLPMPSSFVPAMGYGDITDRMSIGDRFKNFIYATFEYGFHALGAYRTTNVFRKHFGSDFPHVGKIVGDSPLVLVNVEEFVDMPRPSYHNFVYIGGLGLHDTKNLSLGEFEAEMQKGKNGVILFSFGSVIPSTFFPDVLVENVVKTIKHLPDYHFILKVDKNDTKMREAMKNLPNIFLTSWAPQPAILNHERLQLFITHGGYNSIVESARFGVPLALVGFFGDQPLNAMTVQRNGWGLSVPKTSLLRPSDEFETKVKRILGDSSFKTAAKRTQRLILTKPTTAEQRVTSYMRFLEQNEGKLPELQTEGRNLSFVEFYNLDLLLIFALCLLLFATSVFYGSCLLFRLVFSQKLKVKTS